MDFYYYKNRTVQIYSTGGGNNVPVLGVLHPILEGFGEIYSSHRFRVEAGASVKGDPNIAIVVFCSLDAVDNVLESSRAARDKSLWRNYNLTAESLRESGPLDEFFAKSVFRKLVKKRRDSKKSAQPKQNQLTNQSPEDQGPPAKRRKTNDQRTSNNTTASGSHTPLTKPPHASSVTPESPEWMRARISQLETELDQAKAERDMAVSEQSVIRIAHEAEQRGRREAMAQKSAAEAALSRKEIEQSRLRSDLEATIARSSTLSKEVDTWRERFAEAEENLKLAQSALDESASHGDETSEAKAKIKEYKFRVKQLKSDLTNTQERLESTQSSLESMEQKYSSAREKYKSTKAKLGEYKTRLNDERSLLEKLKETLTPAAYQSLGTMHETMGALLSAMELSPVHEDGNHMPKNEPDEDSSAET